MHSGFSPNTVATAHLFRRVLCVELQRDLAAAAQRNLETNGCKNVTVVRADARCIADELVARAGLEHGCTEGGIDEHAASVLREHQFSTLLLDPPRGGLDDATLRAAEAIDNLLCIFCNAEAMLDNLRQLTKSHEVVAMCFLDMFPFTDFLEVAVRLKRKAC
jgi:tRNA (uracil-5-)-methyltransferase